MTSMRVSVREAQCCEEHQARSVEIEEEIDGNRWDGVGEKGINIDYHEAKSASGRTRTLMT